MFIELDKEKKKELLKTMHLSRAFETKVNEMFMKGMIHGTTHLGLGQEANHAALSAALCEGDWILPTHRGHGHFIGKGGSVYSMMAELFASKYGIDKGLGGSMHMTDTKNYNMGSSGVVAGAVPIAVGMAFALKKQKKDNLVAVCLGDGAFNQGMTQESLNLAAVWQVPVLFFCENNMYAMSTPSRKYVSGNISDRAASYDIKTITVDGNDVIAVYDAVSAAQEYIKREKKPCFIESKTYRWLGHSKSDLRKYRTKEEEEYYKSLCPIMRYEEYLINEGIITREYADGIQKECEELIEDSVLFSEKTRGDILTIEEAMQYVYDGGSRI
ncbi:MAG: thiamine pyrophosphate-dependent dehydrogenase E1 component subunit alpha [Anaerofustis stercorihominis]|nr:thiamine pyrophosphate-dependent dehydrogenase E1 component subunit alpha [Anaerofustis stercorihominis]